MQNYANTFEGIHMTGSATPSCGFGLLNGNRVTPSGFGTDPGYPSCVIDWDQEDPDAPDDIIVAFVSLHDAMCSTIDGCLPFDTAAYQSAHADLVAKGYPVVWVEVEPVGDAAMQARAEGLNDAVALALGCTLVDYTIRVAATYGRDPLPPAGRVDRRRPPLTAGRDRRLRVSALSRTRRSR